MGNQNDVSRRRPHLESHLLKDAIYQTWYLDDTLQIETIKMFSYQNIPRLSVKREGFFL